MCPDAPRSAPFVIIPARSLPHALRLHYPHEDRRRASKRIMTRHCYTNARQHLIDLARAERKFPGEGSGQARTSSPALPLHCPVAPPVSLRPAAEGEDSTMRRPVRAFRDISVIIRPGVRTDFRVRVRGRGWSRPAGGQGVCVVQARKVPRRRSK